MNIQTALLPHKHVSFSQSLIGIAGLLLRFLSEPRSVDELWALTKSIEGWPSKPSFSEVVLSLDLLFCVGQISMFTDGRVQRVAK